MFKIQEGGVFLCICMKLVRRKFGVSSLFKISRNVVELKPFKMSCECIFFQIKIDFLKKKQDKGKTDKIKSPWMTRCILKSVRNKNKLYKFFLDNPNDRNRQKYTKYKNKLNHIIKLAKKICYEKQLIKHRQNPKMMWKTLNELLNKPNKNTKLSKRLLKVIH